MPRMNRPNPRDPFGGGDASMDESQERDYLQGLGPDGPLPPQFKRDDQGNVTSSKNFFQDHSWLGPLLFAGGAAAAGPLAGAIGGPGGGSAALGPSTAGNMAATGAATGAPAGIAGGSGGNMGFLSTLFGGGGKKGMFDPQTLMLALTSLFGGGNPNGMESFRSPGSITDPIQALHTALASTARLGQGLTEQAPVKLRSSYVQAPPSPISIPGLPFQIGGGMGRDPALADPSLLTAQDRGNPAKYDPFQSQDATGSNGNSKLRKP